MLTTALQLSARGNHSMPPDELTSISLDALDPKVAHIDCILGLSEACNTAQQPTQRPECHLCASCRPSSR